MSKVLSPMSDVRCRKLEVGSWKSDVRGKWDMSAQNCFIQFSNLQIASSSNSSTKLIVLLVIALCTATGNIFAQSLLTLDSAISIALQNNYDIVLAKNDSAVAHRNNTIGNAGMLPNLSVNGGASYGLTDIDQRFVNGTEIARDNVQSTNFNASANLNWTLFDGLRMFFAKRRLSMQESFSVMQLKERVQTTVAQVVVAYHEIVRQQQTVSAYKEAIALAEERLKIANTKVELGISAKTDALQARIDANARKAELLKQEALFEVAKQNLNTLLSRNPDLPFTVSGEVKFEENLSVQALQEVKNNFLIQAAMVNVGIAKQLKKEANAQRSPVIVGNAAYSYSYAQSDAGFALFNQNYGLGLGVTVSMPIFNGFNINRQVKIASIELQSANTRLEQTKLQVAAGLKKSAREYEAAFNALRLEEENIGYARENITISTERFKLSQSTSIEFREAQKSYEDALLRLANARFDLKQAETELLRLNNKLIN